MCGEMYFYFCWIECECMLLAVTVQCSFSLKHVLGGATPPASNPPHIPSPNSTAAPPPPPGGVAAAVSLPATNGQTNSSLKIKHPAGKRVML